MEKNFSHVTIYLLLCQQKIQVSDRECRPLIGKTHNVIGPIKAVFIWATNKKICYCLPGVNVNFDSSLIY